MPRRILLVVMRKAQIVILDSEEIPHKISHIIHITRSHLFRGYYFTFENLST